MFVFRIIKDSESSVINNLALPVNLRTLDFVARFICAGREIETLSVVLICFAKTHRGLSMPA